jgi:transcriptional regulator with XRE-family HTH domain
MGIPALPFSKMSLKVPKPLNKNLIENPYTLGEKIRNRRLELRFLQKDVAKIIGVSEDAIRFWENNRSKPSVKFYPKICQFLGFIPFDFNQITLGDCIRKYRYLNGLSQEKMAKQIGVNESTIFHYENNNHRPSTKALKKLNVIINPKFELLIY